MAPPIRRYARFALLAHRQEQYRLRYTNLPQYLQVHRSNVGLGPCEPVGIIGPPLQPPRHLGHGYFFRIVMRERV
jgi:hypothetical protein